MAVEKIKRRLQRWQRVSYRWLWLRREGPAEQSHGVLRDGVALSYFMHVRLARQATRVAADH